MKSAHPLDRPLLQLTPHDALTGRDLCEGLIAFGATGSGKSSTFARMSLLSMMAAGLGGVLFAAKSDDAETYYNFAREAGRERDVIFFSDSSGHVFDPLAYEWDRQQTKDTESILDLIDTLMSVGRNAVESSADRFWEYAAAMLARAVIVLLSLAGRPVSINNMSRVIESLPTRPGEFEEQAWQRDSECAAVFRDVRARADDLSGPQWTNTESGVRFCCQFWPSLDERPRSSVYYTFAGMADRFRYDPLSRLFCSGRYSFTPEDATERGKIIICDFPTLTYGIESARLMTCAIKVPFQRAFLRRDVNKHPNIAFLVSDEAQMFILPKGRDNQFQSVCRGSRIASIYLTQSINSIAEALGEQTPGSKTKAWVSNMNTKVFMQNSDPDTNQFAADLIGKEWSSVRNVSAGGSSPQFGETETLRHRVEPDEFTRLLRPDAGNPCAEAIVFQHGKRFRNTRSEAHPNGVNYLRVHFSR